MPFSIRDWFCLNDDRDSFKPHNWRDRGVIFCHQQLVSDDIIGSIERRFASNEPVKMLLYGDWGAGKTHTINHICWWLDANKASFPATPLEIEIGDVNKKTRFDSLLSKFIEKFTAGAIINLVHEYLAKRGDVKAALGAAGVEPHVAEVFSKLLMAPRGGTPPPMVGFAIDYLKGQKPSAAAASIGLVKPLSESNEFFSVLLALGEMFRAVNGHRLLFMADEGAKLEAVDSDDATRGHWVNVNKLIFDDNNGVFGFIYTISGRRRNLPQALFEPQIQNRLGRNAFEIANLGPADVGQFLTRLVAAFVNRPRVDALVAAGEIPAAAYNWSDYPFDAAARAEFVDYFSRTQENAKPRDITDKLDDVAFIAGRKGKRLIDLDSLQMAGM